MRRNIIRQAQGRRTQASRLHGGATVQETTTVEGNLVTNADLGVALSDNQDGYVRGNLVDNSVFDGYTLEYIGLLSGDLGCSQFPCRLWTTSSSRTLR
jgi:parallel beta-helix repeat protein